MVTLLDPRWIQGAFSTLVGLFDRIVLQKKNREDSRHGMPPITGGRESVRGGVRATDDGRGPFLLGLAEGKGAV